VKTSIFFKHLIIPCAILALILHRLWFNILECLWLFSDFLVAVTMSPQLFLWQRTGGAETLTSHYLFALGATVCAIFLTGDGVSTLKERLDIMGLRNHPDLGVCGFCSHYLTKTT